MIKVRNEFAMQVIRPAENYDQTENILGSSYTVKNGLMNTHIQEEYVGAILPHGWNDCC